jgi:hypothetical protein
MLGDALWAFAACLIIEALFGPVARIVCMMRYRVLVKDPPRNADPQPAATDAAKQKAS